MDTDIRNLQRLASTGDATAVARLARYRDRVGKLPRHSWAHQRERLMRILRDDWSGDAVHLAWHEDYAEGSGKGSAPHGVVVADWNFPRLERISRLFDRLPNSERPELDWSDCYSRCDGCNLAIRTEPTCYSWEPMYLVTDGETLCAGCVTEDIGSILDWMLRRGKRCDVRLPDWAIEAAQGFRLYDD